MSGHTGSKRLRPKRSTTQNKHKDTPAKDDGQRHWGRCTDLLEKEPPDGPPSAGPHQSRDILLQSHHHQGCPPTRDTTKQETKPNKRDGFAAAAGPLRKARPSGGAETLAHGACYGPRRTTEWQRVPDRKDADRVEHYDATPILSGRSCRSTPERA